MLGPTGKPPNRGVNLCWKSALMLRAGQVPDLRSSNSSSGDGKTLVTLAVSCECGRTPFPGAEYGLSTQKRVEKLLRFPTLFFCSAGVVACAPSGALPHTLLGPAPDPSKGYRARFILSLRKIKLGWAECRFAVWFSAFDSPAASLSFFLHSVAWGGVGCRGTPLLTSLSAYSASPFQK